MFLVRLYFPESREDRSSIFGTYPSFAMLRQRKRVKSLKIWKICKNLSQSPKLTCETETYGFRNDTTLSMTVIDCLATVATVIWRKSTNFANFPNFRLSDFERITNGTSWEIGKSVDLNLWKTHVVFSLTKEYIPSYKCKSKMFSKMSWNVIIEF